MTLAAPKPSSLSLQLKRRRTRNSSLADRLWTVGALRRPRQSRSWGDPEMEASRRRKHC